MDEKRKRDTRGRKIATSERRPELLAAFDASGLTQRVVSVKFRTFELGWQGRRKVLVG